MEKVQVWSRDSAIIKGTIVLYISALPGVACFGTGPIDTPRKSNHSKASQSVSDPQKFKEENVRREKEEKPTRG